MNVTEPTVWQPAEPTCPDPERWVREHPPTDRYVVDCLGLGQGAREAGTKIVREKVLVRATLLTREYEWREHEEPVLEFPWYLIESWQVPHGGTVSRKTEISEQTARMLVEEQGVRRGR